MRPTRNRPPQPTITEIRLSCAGGQSILGPRWSDAGHIRGMSNDPLVFRAFLASVLVGAMFVLSGCDAGSREIEVTLYGDGDISCPDHWADDTSLPVGTVLYQPGEGELVVSVDFTEVAPSTGYEVSLWKDDSCEDEEPFYTPPWTFRSNDQGVGSGQFVLSNLEPGTYQFSLNVVPFDDGADDPRLEEIATPEFSKVVIP